MDNYTKAFVVVLLLVAAMFFMIALALHSLFSHESPEKSEPQEVIPGHHFVKE